jgi:F-type H+-transporting ATPase subunit epsilon
VLVSVRRAMGGTDLAHLHALVEREYLTLDEDERSLREVSAKLENGFLHRFAELQRD